MGEWRKLLYLIMGLLDKKSQYEFMTDAVVTTLLADDGIDGLREVAGGIPVKTIQAELRGEDEPFKRDETPAIAIVPGGKNQDEVPREQQRDFLLSAWVYIRTHDKKLAKKHMQRIVSRVEFVIDEQWDHDKLMSGVEKNLIGSGKPGSLTTAILSTKLMSGKLESDAKGDDPEDIPEFLLLGIIEFSVGYVADIFPN